MDYVTPEYDFDYNHPVIGFGNFSKDYNPELRCSIDTDVVEQKFRLWDDVVASKILMKNFKNDKGVVIDKNGYRQQLKARLLLRDKTIFSYANFKFDNAPLKLRYYQDVLLSDTGKRMLFAASNQIGKSITLDADAAVCFLQDHGKNWVGVLVSKSLDQSQYQMDRIKGMLKSAGIDYRTESTVDKNTGKKDNTVKISYTFYDKAGKAKYTNLLICSPPTGSALGYPCDEMWLDEFDFWENIDQHWFIFQIAIPRTYDTDGNIKIFTNPDGKGKMLYQLWNLKDKKGNYVWHRYNFNYWDKPDVSQDDFDTKTVGQTKQQTESTMLAMFSTSSKTFLSTQEINNQLDESLNDASGYGRETAWFLDVGTVKDQSVLTGGYVEHNELSPDMPLIKAFYIHKYPQGYPIARVLGLDRLKGTLTSEQITALGLDLDDDGWSDYVEDNPSVVEVLDRYAEIVKEGDGKIKKYFPLYGYDVTGNQALIALHNVLNIDAVDITFSGPRKWHMYSRYKVWTQQKWLKRAQDRDDNVIAGKDFAYQASKLVEKRAQGRNYSTIHHENEDDYDDTQDSICAMIHLIDNPEYPTLNFDIINNGVSVLEEVEKEIESIKKDNDQYIPSWVNGNELNNWMSKRELE